MQIGLFSHLADTFHVSVDQVIFFYTQITSLVVAVFFRKQLSSSRVSSNTRHVFGSLIGIVLLYWCYGWSLLHMVAQCLGVYAIMTLLPPHLGYKLAFIYGMMYLMYVQIIRIRGLPSFSSPVMISTTKLTGLVFSVHDGVHKQRQSLSAFQDKYAVRKYPSLIEVFGYVFHFSGIICGPTFFFSDYIDFIDGSNCTIPESNSTTVQNNNLKAGQQHTKNLNPTRDVLKKVFTSLLCLFIHLVISSKFPVAVNGELDFINSHGILYRWFYFNVSLLLLRYRYYFVWVLGEAIQNAAGLGLHFMDGKPQWDLTNNINILKLDTATSLKDMTDNWNIMVSKWLRLVAYERGGQNRLPLTYLLTSVWHGVEPGYHVTFVTLVPVTMAARKVRKSLRPFFVGTKWKLGYDVLTGISAYFAVHYAMAGFHLLYWLPTYNFFRHSMFFWLHLLLAIILVTPLPLRKTKDT